MLKDLFERFGQNAAVSPEAGEHADELRKIDAWLGKRLNLRREGESALARTIKAVEEFQPRTRKRKRDESPFTSALDEELERLSGAWAMLCIREWIGIDDLTVLMEGLETVVREHAEMERPNDNGSDELVRFVDFPVCAAAVLSWLQGNFVSPRAGDYISDYGAAQVRARFAPERLLRRRIAEFKTWLEGLDYTMDGAFFPNESGSAVREQFRRLDRLLQKRRVEAVPNAESLRESYRKRASETLAGVCSAKLGNYIVDPHKLFKYVVDRGMTSVGKKKDQPLSAKAYILKNNCVVSLA